MSKARDIANILSASTNIATDAEVASALSSERLSVATLENKVIDGNLNTIHIKRGTTDNRPATATFGDQYFDTTEQSLYNYYQDGWRKVSQDPAPQIASISPTTSATSGTLITITGSNYKSGLTVKFIGTNAAEYSSPVATFVNATTATATTPSLPVAYEPYDVRVTNNDNQFAVLNDCLDAGATPTWNTASGNILNIGMGSNASVSVSATDPDGTSIIYSSTDLPVWLSLNSSSGLLTGLVPEQASATTYTFNIIASDGVNSISRSFNISSYVTNYFGNSSDGVGVY